LLVFETLPSTNRWMLDNLDSLRHGDVVRAVSQTAGTGRFQRQWLSPGDRCLTVSVMLQPASLAPIVAAQLTRVASLAVTGLLEDRGIAPQVKWPNDVLVDGRKIAGILAEREQASRSFVLGVGLNVNMVPDDFAGAELLNPVTSMAIEKGSGFDVDDVCAGFIEKLAGTIDALSLEGPRYLRERWQLCDALAGKNVDVRTHDEIVSGRYAGLDPEGRLRLVTGDGEERLFWSGDASVAR